MANVGTAYVTIAPSMKGFISALVGGSTTAGTSSGKAFTSSFSSSGTSKIGTAMGAVAGVAMGVASTAFSAIGSSLGQAIARVDQLNNFPKVMQNLGYSADDASRSIQKMSSAIDGLPTSLDSLSSLTQQLAPLCSNLDEATDISIALNNALLAGGASSESVNRALTQYTQALSKGKPDLMDWRTLQEVMPGQLNQIAQAMLGAGKNSTDLYNALKNGEVTMSDFNQAVLKLNSEGLDGFASFEQQAKDSTQGIATAITNTGNRISKAVATIINAFGANRISGAINAFTGSFGKIADVIAPAFSLLGNLSEWTINKIKDAFSGLGTLLNPIVQPLQDKWQALMDAWGKSADTVKDRLSGTWQGVKVAFDGVFKQLAGGSFNFSGLVATFDTLKGSLERVFDDTPVQAFVNSAKSKLSTLFQGAVSGNFFQTLFGEGFSSMPAGLQTIFSTLNTNAQVLASVFESVRDRLACVFSAIHDKLNGLGTINFSGLGDGISGAIQLAFDKIAPIVEFSTGLLTTFVSFFTTIWQGLAESFSSLNFDMTGLSGLMSIASLASPIGLLSQVISNLGSQILPIINQVLTALAPVVVTVASSFMQLATQLLTSLAPVVSTIVSTLLSLASAVLPVVMQVITMLTPYIQTIATIVSQLLETLTPIITTLIAQLIPCIQNIISAITPLVQAVLNVAQAVLPIISARISMVIGLIQALLPIITSIISVVVSVASSIISALTPVITFIIGIVSTVVNVIALIIDAISPGVSIIVGVITTVISIIASVIGAILSIASNVIQVGSSIISFVSDLVSKIINTITSFISTIVNGISSFVGSIVDFVTSMWSNISNAFSSGVASVIEFVTSIPQKITDLFSNAGSLLLNAGKNIIDGLIDGLKGAVGAITNFFTNMLGDVKDQVLGFFGIKSPSRMFMYVGEMMMQGWAKGLDKFSDLPQDVMDKANSSLSPSLDLAYQGAVSATANLATAGAGDTNSNTINIALNYKAGDDAQILFKDLVGRLERYTRIRG